MSIISSFVGKSDVFQCLASTILAAVTVYIIVLWTPLFNVPIGAFSSFKVLLWGAYPHKHGRLILLRPSTVPFGSTQGYVFLCHSIFLAEARAGDLLADE